MKVTLKQFSILFVFTLQTGRLFADTTDQRKLDFFESRIRPVLAEQCYSCHSASAKKLKGELLLDSRWGWQKGGESGPPIVPGNPEESLIIDALRHPPCGFQSDGPVIWAANPTRPPPLKQGVNPSRVGNRRPSNYGIQFPARFSISAACARVS